MVLDGNVTTILGKNSLHIASSIIFVIILFLYIFSIGSYFQTSTSSFENRVNYHKPFITYVFGKNIDEIIIVCATTSWLALSLLKRLRIIIPVIYVGLTTLSSLLGSITLDAAILFSLPIVLSLLIYDNFITKILNFSGSLNLRYLSVLFVVLSVLSLIVSSAPLFSFQSSKIQIHDYLHDIFLLFGSFSPVLISVLILGSSVKLLIGKSIFKIFKTEKLSLLTSNKKSTNKILCLSLIMVLSIILSFIPHQATVNSDNQSVGSDSGDYVIWLRSLANSKDTSDFIHQAFVVQSGGDRPISLIFFYAVSKIAPSNPSYIMDHLPIMLAPALVLSMFLLTREITSNDRTSLFVAFFTAVSFQTLIGIYGGLYANFFSLIVGYLSFVFLIRFLKKSGRTNFIIYILLMILFVFSHVYTWTVFTLVMSIFLVLMYKLNHYDKKRIIFVFLVVLLSVSVDVSRTVITNTHGGISQDIALANNGGASLPQLAMSWNTLIDTMQNYGGGQFGNFIILILGLYWLFKSDLRTPTGVLLAIFLSIGILPLLFGSDLIQSRVFYEIPFQMPAGIALAYLTRKINVLMISSICIWMFAISLKMATNFYFVPPS